MMTSLMFALGELLHLLEPMELLLGHQTCLSYIITFTVFNLNSNRIGLTPPLLYSVTLRGPP